MVFALVTQKDEGAEAEDRTASVIRLMCEGFCIHRCWWLVSETFKKHANANGPKLSD